MNGLAFNGISPFLLLVLMISYFYICLILACKDTRQYGGNRLPREVRVI